MRLFPLVLSLALGACSMFGDDPGPPPPVDADSLVADTTEAGLERYSATWEEAGVASYRFRFTRACECGPEAAGPFEVVVRDGEIASVDFFGGGNRAQGEQHGRMTLEALFDTIADAFAENAAFVYVEYEPRLGFPASVFIDYHQPIVDEELSLTLSAFERLDR